MRVVYNSFSGRFSDSPLAIFRALRARDADAVDEHVWLMDPALRDTFAPDVTTVEFGSADAVGALEAADVVVGNTHLEADWDQEFAWEKADGAVYLQTWHGTPLKRIHRDSLWTRPGQLERLQRDVDRWDLLVSPNADSTPRLRRAFGYDGPILETGYPRNDVLRSAQADRIRRRVRAQLGVDDGTRVILYAPTWRDAVVYARGTDAIALELDVDGLLGALGAGHCVLLRLHHLLAGRLGAVTHPDVRDVSAHPDISELYLAADVLVTDYSSSMFDFAITGKPLLFFTYDLDEYRDSVRGFSFDLEAIAPGPLPRTTPELAAALGRLPQVTAEYAARYAAFRERFCHLEDGDATQRVVDALLRTRAGRRP